ncbi:unnamed protein product [Urochloa humidicola]
MAAARRPRPNVLVTGTPGTGKTTTCSLLAEAAGLRHVNIGDLVREKSLHDGWDDELECHVINEDLVCDELEDRMEEGGILVDYHGCDFFPERWFDLVVVLQTDNSILHDRLTRRGYTGSKLSNNRVRDLPSAPGGGKGELQRGHRDALAKRQCGGY